MKIKIGDDGKTVYNIENNQKIGSMIDGKLVLDKNQEKLKETAENEKKDDKSDADKNIKKEDVKKSNVKKTKYEVTKDTTFTVSFGLVKVEDRYIIIQNDMVSYTSDSEPVWVKFRMWTYLEELKWKNDCLDYDARNKTQFLNINKLNEMKIKNLILDWSFSEIDDKFKLLHTDGKLSDESYSVFCGLLPNIANAIVNAMNDVLENNK